MVGLACAVQNLILAIGGIPAAVAQLCRFQPLIRTPGLLVQAADKALGLADSFGRDRIEIVEI